MGAREAHGWREAEDRATEAGGAGAGAGASEPGDVKAAERVGNNV